MSDAARRPGVVFGLLLGITILAGAGAALIFSLALVRGGGAIAGRWLLVAAIAALGGAVIVARRLRPARSGITMGFAASGALTAAAFAVRALADVDAVGPVDLAGIGAGVLMAVAAPWLASLAERWSLVERLATVWPSAESVAARPAGISWSEWAVVGAGLAVLAVALGYVLPEGTLGHDESVYAVQARSWVDGSPATGFRTYRPVGMPMVGFVVLQFAESEVALRTAAVVIAVGVVIVMWGAGRTMLGATAALIGTATFMVSESYLRRATEFLNDLASAGLMLAALFFIWLHFERRPNGWWLLVAAPAAAGAYYMRYGSLFGLVVIAVVAAAIWFRRLGASWRPIAATGGLFAALLLPHFAYSQRITGSVFGVLRAAREHAAGVGGFGVDDYLGFFPERLAGTFGAIVMVLGVIYAVMLAVSARSDSAYGPAARTAGYLTVTAVVMTVFLGLFTHGEPRFIFLPMMALLLVGGRAVAMLLNRLSDRARWAAVGALALLLFYALGTGAGEMHNRMERITTSRDVVADSAAFVRADAGAASCTVHSAFIPQVTWYSVCSTHLLREEGEPAERSYVLLFGEPGLDDNGGDPLAVVTDEMGVFGDGYVYESDVGSGR